MKFLLSLAIVFVTLEPTVFGDSRVYRGHKIAISDAPWMAYMSYRLLHAGGAIIECGGTIVDDMFILTAAHCVVDEDDDVVGSMHTMNASQFRIRVGSADNIQGGSVYQVSNVYPHPDYHGLGHDVGLLKLTKKIAFNDKTVKKIRLDTSKRMYKSGEKVSSMGWGENPQHPDSTQLYAVDLTVVESGRCAKTYFDPADYYKKHFVCAEGRKDADVCEGDSGGPLLDKNNVQIGVVSYGPDCPRDNKQPGVYSTIRDNLKWINSIISGGNKNGEDCS